jgi:hypothetical protein
MTDLDQPIGELMAPLAPQMEQLTSIPGVEATASPENAWPSGEALHLSSSTRHSALPQGATRE